MVGKKIMKLRQLMQITQQELGEMLGITEAQISHYETSKRIPSMRVAHKLIMIAKKFNFGLKLDDFVRE